MSKTCDIGHDLTSDQLAITWHDQAIMIPGVSLGSINMQCLWWLIPPEVLSSFLGTCFNLPDPCSHVYSSISFLLSPFHPFLFFFLFFLLSLWVLALISPILAHMSTPPFLFSLPQELVPVQHRTQFVTKVFVAKKIRKRKREGIGPIALHQVGDNQRKSW